MVYDDIDPTKGFNSSLGIINELAEKGEPTADFSFNSSLGIINNYTKDNYYIAEVFQFLIRYYKCVFLRYMQRGWKAFQFLIRYYKLDKVIPPFAFQLLFQFLIRYYK